MSRLIDADELNEYIGREALDTREKIFALVHRMPTVERLHGEWIPCSERLPDMDNGDAYEVLCCDDVGYILVAHPFASDDSDSGYSAENDGCYLYNCTAWMPLPEPYMKEGDEK